MHGLIWGKREQKKNGIAQEISTIIFIGRDNYIDSSRLYTLRCNEFLSASL